MLIFPALLPSKVAKNNAKMANLTLPGLGGGRIGPPLEFFVNHSQNTVLLPLS